MVLPVVAYGDPVLRKVSQEIDQDYKNLQELIQNMFDTMYDSNGCLLYTSDAADE